MDSETDIVIGNPLSTGSLDDHEAPVFGASSARLAKGLRAFERVLFGLEILAEMRRTSGFVEYQSSWTISALTNVVSPTVGVVGEEGAGKSTLINSILGQDIVPTDPDRPGTVAPVLVTSGPHRAMNHFVAHSSATQPEPVTETAFQSYLLQRFNVNNHKRVTRGVIEVPRDTLSEWLRIVDLPGLEGASCDLAKEAEVAVSELGRAILVIRDRQFGPGLRVVERLLQAGCALDAVVINLGSTSLKDEATLQPLPEREVSDHIRKLKENFITELIKRDATLAGIDVFAMHLLSVRGLRLKPETDIRVAAHTMEIENFRSWFKANYGEIGAERRLRRALECAGVAVDKIGDLLANEATLIDGLISGDFDITKKLLERVTEYLAELPRGWEMMVRAANLERIGYEAWEMAQLAIERAQRRLTTAIDEAKTSTPPRLFGYGKGIVQKTVQDLNQTMTRERGIVEGAVQEACECYRHTCLTVSHEMAHSERMLLPIYRSDGVIGDLRVPPIEFKPLWDDLLLVAHPINLQERVSSNALIRRLLLDAGAAEATIDPKRGGLVYDRFVSRLAQLREVHLQMLKARINMIITIIKDRPTSFEITRTALCQQQIVFNFVCAARAEALSIFDENQIGQ